MNTVKRALRALGVAALLSSATIVITPVPSVAMEAEMKMPSTPQAYASEAEKYDREAADLGAKAKHHEAMAKLYRASAGGGSKQAASLLSLAQHCERLAKLYSDAAAAARQLATSAREMSKSG